MTVAKYTNIPFDGVLTGPAIFDNAQHLNVRGRMLAIYMISRSGKIIYRNKIDTIIGIVHPGIILGSDEFSVIWVIHNHYKIGHPEIVTLEEFAEGVQVFEDIRTVSYSPMEIVERSIESWKQKKQYSWLSHNCQQFVNNITLNKNHSEALEKIANRGLLVGGGLLLLGIFMGNKNLIKAGLTVGVIGVGVKAMNQQSVFFSNHKIVAQR
jgi:hypothetical protein